MWKSLYRQEMPNSDEGPFLKEERKLIETVAERIASSYIQRRLKAAFEDMGRDRAAQRAQKRSGALFSSSFAIPIPLC